MLALDHERPVRHSSLCTLIALPAAAAPRNDKLYAAVQASRAGFLDLLSQIVNIDSGTGDVAGGDKVLALLTPTAEGPGRRGAARTGGSARPARQSGGDVSRHRQGPHPGHRPCRHGVRPRHGGAASLSHGRHRAYGPGVGDEKAGVVSAIIALKTAARDRLQQLRHDHASAGDQRGARLAGTTPTDQARWRRSMTWSSTWSRAIRPTLSRSGARARSVIHIQVKGRAAHAGVAPQDGRNAATELIHQIDSIKDVAPLSGDGPTSISPCSRRASAPTSFPTRPRPC